MLCAEKSKFEFRKVSQKLKRGYFCKMSTSVKRSDGASMMIRDLMYDRQASESLLTQAMDPQ